MTRIKQPHRRMTRWLGGALPVVVAALVAPPIASASASLNGTDPYRSGCARGATVAGYGLITDNIHPPLGRIYLMWSPRCQTNWGIAYFNDGNKASDPVVDISVWGTDPSQPDTAPPAGPGPYPPNVYNVYAEYQYSGVGSPVWGNQVFAPGCAGAIVYWGNAVGIATQIGCPGLGGPGGP
jgi:hypothetical protein